MEKESMKLSEEVMEVASDLLLNGCEGCKFFDHGLCDSVPLNCKWLAVYGFMKFEEKKEKINEQRREER